MGDNADGSVGHSEIFKSGQSGVERGGIEGAKAFVDEKTFNSGITAGEVGQPQRKGKTHEEGFSSRKAASGSSCIGLVAIHNF